MKKIFLVLLTAGLLMATGCFSAERARILAAASPHKIHVLSGGKVVMTFHSVGRVLPEKDSDGWFFEDRKTGKLVHVAGTVVIEQE